MTIDIVPLKAKKGRPVFISKYIYGGSKGQGEKDQAGRQLLKLPFGKTMEKIILKPICL